MTIQWGPIVVGLVAIAGGISIFVNRERLARDAARRQRMLGRLGQQVSRGASGRTVGAIAIYMCALGLVILVASIFASFAGR